MEEILLIRATRLQSVRSGEWLLVDDPFELPFVVRSAQVTRIRVTLKRPDGTTSRVIAAITRPLDATNREKGHFCLLKNQDKDSVPSGTELWLDPADFRGE